MSKKTRQIQITLAILASILAVALYFAPARKKNLKSAKPSQISYASIDQVINSAKEELSPTELSTIASWEMSLQTGDSLQKIALYDSLATAWQSLNSPYISSYYLKRMAEIDQSNESAIRSGRSYYNAFLSLQDSSLKSESLQQATSLFETALKNDPENEDLQLDMALCFVESSAPMQGIMMLRALVEKNPKNENAIFNLGVLSMRSGQYEKAIERFNQILDFAPQRHELFLYIADSYVQLGEKNQAIDYFSRFKSQATDKGLIGEIDRYIEQLKNED